MLLERGLKGLMGRMGARADLHMHTQSSDGFLAPAEVVNRAKVQGLSIVSITDHDTVDGLPEAMEEGRATGVEVVPGVELSVTLGDRELHLLGYFLDVRNQRLLDYLAFFRRERVRRAERIVDKLNQLKIPLSIDAVLERAKSGSVGRPHIATAMVDEGLIASYQQAFEKYIGTNGPAYERKFQLAPAEAIQLIASSGGLSFLAHPGRSTSDDTLQQLIKSGLDGIEVIHPSHAPDLVTHYRGVVSEYFLLESGGSDFHGGGRNDLEAIGAYFIDEDRVDAMKRRLFAHRHS